jgi:hypothetical protein
MPQKKQQLKITITCKRVALRKWRGLREGCTVVPSMRSTALLRLPVYFHPPPQQQHKRTLNLAVKQNAELTTTTTSSFPHKTKKTGTRERGRERENLAGETNWFGAHQVHAHESLHSDWKTVAPR